MNEILRNLFGIKLLEYEILALKYLMVCLMVLAFDPWLCWPIAFDA